MELLLALIAIGLGYFFGKRAETKHFKKLLEKEKTVNSMGWRNTGLKEDFSDTSGVLVYGGVVIAQDAFKSFLASLVNIFGGRVTSYESLVERGRREAILRARLKAKALGAKELVNLRVETSVISTNAKNSSGAIEILCYATAII